MNYFNEIINLFPVRKNDKDKSKFRDYVLEKANQFGFEGKVETLDKKHNNILIGSLEEAEVIYTAHYDTPATSLFPNIMIPVNKVISYMYHFGVPLLYALSSLGVAYLLQCIFNFDITILMVIYLILYFTLFYLATRAFENKNNYNDNTSGIAALLEMMSLTKSNKVAFIFFDNEEKGLLGSKAFNKHHKELLSNKLIINLDCVGFGNEIIITEKDDAIKSDVYQKIKKNLVNSSKYSFNFYPYKKTMLNSDNKNFKISIGIVTCKKAKIVKFYTSKIHTNKDIEVNVDNISYLADLLIKEYK